MRATLVALVLIVACGGSRSLTSLPAPATAAPKSTFASTTTKPLRVATEVWFEGYLSNMFEKYNSEFASSFDSHLDDFELGEARLDCVEGNALMATWQASVPEGTRPAAPGTGR